MLIVTGGSGFIGSCLVAALNERGRQDLVIVDHWDEDPLKKKNLENKKFLQYLDKKEFLGLIRQDKLPGRIDGVLHMGACSSTLLKDPHYYEQNNFEYSCHVAQWALKHRARLIYASSGATYGDGTRGYKDDDATTRRLKPLNFYGHSKHKFDLWVLDHGYADRFVGLKFFNVFGPNEYHKGEMRSVIHKAFGKVAAEGRMELFKSYLQGYADGEQKRDFIYVKDAVRVVMFFLDHPQINGIFNVGTGRARTWNDLARALFAAVGKPPRIDFVDMPEYLKPRYQYFTEADIGKLRAAGYRHEFLPLEDALKDYAGYLKSGRHL